MILIRKTKGFTLALTIHFCKDCGHISLAILNRDITLMLYYPKINEQEGEKR